MDGDLQKSISGQVALVTGANRGIGAEITKQLTEHDATVYAAPEHRDGCGDAGLARPISEW